MDSIWPILLKLEMKNFFTRFDKNRFDWNLECRLIFRKRTSTCFIQAVYDSFSE